MPRSRLGFDRGRLNFGQSTRSGRYDSRCHRGGGASLPMRPEICAQPFDRVCGRRICARLRLRGRRAGGISDIQAPGRFIPLGREQRLGRGRSSRLQLEAGPTATVHFRSLQRRPPLPTTVSAASAVSVYSLGLSRRRPGAGSAAGASPAAGALPGSDAAAKCSRLDGVAAPPSSRLRERKRKGGTGDSSLLG